MPRAVERLDLGRTDSVERGRGTGVRMCIRRMIVWVFGIGGAAMKKLIEGTLVRCRVSRRGVSVPHHAESIENPCGFIFRGFGPSLGRMRRA